MTAQASWVEEVLSFWFEELSAQDWFSGDAEVDHRIHARFRLLHERLAAQVPEEAMSDPDTALAAIIVYDQFSRNLYRGRPEAFASDAIAIAIARNAVDTELDAGMETARRIFLYMPFMHSEIMADQERCVSLFKAIGEKEQIFYAEDHRDVIERFGRFPHRNRALERESTPEELAFMKEHKGYGQ